jgi:hypothetical protein
VFCENEKNHRNEFSRHNTTYCDITIFEKKFEIPAGTAAPTHHKNNCFSSRISDHHVEARDICRSVRLCSLSSYASNFSCLLSLFFHFIFFFFFLLLLFYLSDQSSRLELSTR